MGELGAGTACISSMPAVRMYVLRASPAPFRLANMFRPLGTAKISASYVHDLV
jgi:hypothetical protein